MWRWLGLQALNLPLVIAGWLILGPLCAFRLWTDTTPAHWRSRALWLWDNDEDGILGKPGYNDARGRWRAYVWSAWRNPVDNFKYLPWTQWKGGPWFLRVFRIGRWQFYVSLGWRTDGLIVGSAGRYGA